MTFANGQRVRMLVACQGNDANDVNRLYPPGAAGIIEGRDITKQAYEVVVGPDNDDSIILHIPYGVADAQMQPLTPPTKIRAEPIAYSSIVGTGVLLCDPDGKIIGQLSVLGVGGGRAEQEAMRDRLVAAINAGQPERQVTHKNGRTYDVLPEALFQVSAPSMGDGKTPFKPRCRVVEDGAKVTVYRNPEGMTFVRFPDEMVSPRFEDVQS